MYLTSTSPCHQPCLPFCCSSSSWDKETWRCGAGALEWCWRYPFAEELTCPGAELFAESERSRRQRTTVGEPTCFKQFQPKCAFSLGTVGNKLETPNMPNESKWGRTWESENFWGDSGIHDLGTPPLLRRHSISKMIAFFGKIILSEHGNMMTFLWTTITFGNPPYPTKTNLLCNQSKQNTSLRLSFYLNSRLCYRLKTGSDQFHDNFCQVLVTCSC